MFLLGPKLHDFRTKDLPLSIHSEGTNQYFKKMIFPQAIECGLDGICPSPGAQWSAGAGEFLSQLAEVRNLLTCMRVLGLGFVIELLQDPKNQNTHFIMTPHNLRVTLSVLVAIHAFPIE